jgi:ABC-type glutathione transport system ATPase component
MLLVAVAVRQRRGGGGRPLLARFAIVAAGGLFGHLGPAYRGRTVRRVNSESDAIVRVEGLHKRYGSSGPEAVAGIDFEIRRGEMFGLLGPNGAGKTTTIGTITTRV